MKRESDYRGYHIVCRLAGRWFAQVFPPNSRRALSEIPAIQKGGDYETILSMAHELVDQKAASKR